MAVYHATAGGYYWISANDYTLATNTGINDSSAGQYANESGADWCAVYRTWAGTEATITVDGKRIFDGLVYPTPEPQPAVRRAIALGGIAP